MKNCGLRKAYAGGGFIDPLGNDFNAINAQSGAESRMNDVMEQMKYGKPSMRQALAPMLEQMQAGYNQDFMNPKGRAGQPVDELGNDFNAINAKRAAEGRMSDVMEQMKYGKPSMRRALAPALKQMQAGYNYAFEHGGEVGVDPKGFIKGPRGVDKVPARVDETGEQILVGAGERIVNREQNEALEALAAKAGMGLDEYLATATGEPVGPTLKHGLRAAANGGLFDDVVDGVSKFGSDTGKYWSEYNRDYAKENPNEGLVGGVAHALNPGTWLGQALGNFHDGLENGDATQAALGVVGSVPALGRTKAVAETAAKSGAMAGLRSGADKMLSMGGAAVDSVKGMFGKGAKAVDAAAPAATASRPAGRAAAGAANDAAFKPMYKETAEHLEQRAAQDAAFEAAKASAAAAAARPAGTATIASASRAVVPATAREMGNTNVSPAGQAGSSVGASNAAQGPAASADTSAPKGVTMLADQGGAAFDAYAKNGMNTVRLSNGQTALIGANNDGQAERDKQFAERGFKKDVYGNWTHLTEDNERRINKIQLDRAVRDAYDPSITDPRAREAGRARLDHEMKKQEIGAKRGLEQARLMLDADKYRFERDKFNQAQNNEERKNAAAERDEQGKRFSTVMVDGKPVENPDRRRLFDNVYGENVKTTHADGTPRTREEIEASSAQAMALAEYQAAHQKKAGERWGLRNWISGPVESGSKVMAPNVRKATIGDVLDAPKEAILGGYVDTSGNLTRGLGSVVAPDGYINQQQRGILAKALESRLAQARSAGDKTAERDILNQLAAIGGGSKQ